MGRKERREQERRERRDAVLPEYVQRKIAARQATMERISQQGISPQDLKRECDKAFDRGFMLAAEPITKGCYAAVVLVLHELFGFGRERCMRVLRALDERLVLTMDGQEYADQVLSDIGVKIDFGEAIDRIVEKGA